MMIYILWDCSEETTCNEYSLNKRPLQWIQLLGNPQGAACGTTQRLASTDQAHAWQRWGAFHTFLTSTFYPIGRQGLVWAKSSRARDYMQAWSTLVEYMWLISGQCAVICMMAASIGVGRFTAHCRTLDTLRASKWTNMISFYNVCTRATDKQTRLLGKTQNVLFGKWLATICPVAEDRYLFLGGGAWRTFWLCHRTQP